MRDVMEVGTDKSVDATIDCLHRICLQNPRTMAEAAVGGEDGMRLTRAAFTVILRYSGIRSEW